MRRADNAISKRTIPLVVRGYSVRVEALGVIHIIGKDETSASVTYKQQQTGARYELNSINEDVYVDLRRFITSKTFKRPTEGPAEGEGRPEASRKAISAILECILKSTRLIYTTPNAAAQKPYKQHYKAARAVMIGEAGAMAVSEASMVIGDRERDSVQCTGLTIERHEKTGEQLATE
ncbi:hypothetical protein FPSE_01471 [Fusarium pseudograminearum CS3096]|uniref:Uncharacterized protein n=1 Tax=Fusarium pseudograminearum (strain CS3096) TaxID=1028729 RepID=K3UZU1_FUSPC|nr:hypothetical protein FPSE_01471 [Fusarium pseudograminearum CS3096]EKJ78366.1 hypothetical protein FPSE_01471 [Fusarium pseudograminearum CS3096]KAF0643628.1 hypothetical protein FPSE5266_01471 [Fusarium pseudograminearum]